MKRKSGIDPWVEALIYSLTTLLCIWLATKPCNAQPNWRILIERDTMAIGPLNDVRKWAGLRMAKNDMARQCAWELSQRSKELTSLYAERDACWDTVNEARKVMDQMRETQDQLITRNDKLARKVRRRKPWLFFGLGAATLYVVQQQVK